MIRKWQTLIECRVDCKTLDGYIIRVFNIDFTKKTTSYNSSSLTTYSKLSQVRAIRKKINTSITNELQKLIFLNSELTKKLISDDYLHVMEKQNQNYFHSWRYYYQKSQIIFKKAAQLYTHDKKGDKATERYGTPKDPHAKNLIKKLQLMSQSYFPWEQNKQNKLLKKSEVGKGKQSTYNLPPITHTYGKPPRRDSENAKDVTMSWQYHQQTKDQEPPRDFIRLNKNCVKESFISPKDIKEYRQQHQEIKKIINKGKKGVELFLPSDDFRYGIKNKPSTPMNQIIELHYASQQEQQIHEFYKKQYDEKVQKKKNRNYNSSQIRGSVELKVNKNVEINNSVENFKLERFKNIQPKINSRPENLLSHNKHQKDKKPIVIFILGGPGCGKGTQCEKIVQNYNFVHLSAGDLLREEMETGSKNAKLIDSYIKEGKIVPKEIIVNLIKQAMEKHGWEKNKYLIDGYPRSQDNVDGWNAIMGDIVDFKFILFFDCSEETMAKRVMKRAQGSGRSDDNIESLKKRFKTYQESTKPIVDMYKKLNKIIIANAEGSPDQVYSQIKPVFEREFGSIKKPQIVFVLGGPGCGKGTQCEKIVQNYNFVHLSAGDLLREEMETGSKNAKLIDSYIKEGKIVPKEIIVNLIKQAMEKHGWEKNKYLIDGYPRSQDNVDGWNAIMGDIVDFKFILFFDCSEETMAKRVMKRAQGSGRSDDNIESLKKRFKTYQESTKPIIEFYRKQNKVIMVDAECPPDQVFKYIQPIFEQI
ncbi:hypothetical protein IMG5_164490 [Ichthyophthirius multifiliis]|uniref:UMP-CMP kinase n=1 Tax=Ichthyophthirius multifiliis TaxID=5932 RepID=G0R0F8_ICHMU|nr:hypothetical protein IMG5_164490 [Ichthyophthirius multifiliis]EGR29037.1 hypothetical protein IMG5_164490 [Ichthyophthirius multifiliis]|eukprot:XP_004030273.1 hypothetical protein IMG5_164490 [Ichthyophthirius multifiliis]